MRHSLIFPGFGSLITQDAKVSFEPAPDLKKNVAARTFLLDGWLKEFIRTSRSNFLGKLTWSNYFLQLVVQDGDPLPGIDFFSYLAADILIALKKKDRKLEHVSLENLQRSLIFYMHDAVVCGAGVELETIGIFRPNLTFEPDNILLDSLAARRVSGELHPPPKWLHVGIRPGEDKKE